VVGNTETIERLKIIAKDGNMPHVIISGMPGIGKTSLSLSPPPRLPSLTFDLAPASFAWRGRCSGMRTRKPCWS
jgi:hypothetical protein